MFKTMDPDVIRELIQDVPDVLTKQAEEEKEFYNGLRCPMCCEAGCVKEIRQAKVVMTDSGVPEVAVSPFGDGPLPAGHARCPHCNTEFDPRSGIIYRTEASKIHAPPIGFPPE
jgi:hypothetical protein